MNDVERLKRRLKSLEDIGHALGSAVLLDDLLVLIVNKITELMEADRSTLFLIDQERGHLWSKIAQGELLEEILLPLGKGLAGWAAAHNQSANVRDAYQDARFDPSVDSRTGYRTHSVLCLPLRDRDGNVVGVIQVLNKKTGEFTAEDEELLQSLAGQATAVLMLSRLYTSQIMINRQLEATQAELQRKIVEQNALYDIERAISTAENIEALVESILSRAAEIIHAEAGSVLMRTGDDTRLYFLAATGARKDELKRLTLQLGQGVVGLVARDGEPLIVDDAANDPRHDRGIAEKIDFPAHSILCVPLHIEDQLIGALEMINKRGGSFTHADLQLLTLIGGQVARAIRMHIGREERERERRLSTLGQMLSSIIHDIKTPMTVMSGYVQLMAMERDDNTRQQYADRIIKQADLLNAMTKEVLSFARGESHLLLTKVYLSKFLEEMTTILTQEFANSGVVLRVEPRYRGVTRFDENKIRRVFYNLARNARQAMPDGGEFRILVEQRGAELLMSFTDTGLGIPPQVQACLFKPFTTSTTEGTGLGLAIVKRIIDEHQGRIEARSEPGQGTTFTFYLPLRAES